MPPALADVSRAYEMYLSSRETGRLVTRVDSPPLI